MKSKYGNGPIDIVLPWVDGNDPEWRKERDKWRKKLGDMVDPEANSEIRYESWDNLKYWFRAVEKFMPWVHKIFFITCGHLPDWLNLENPRLRVVRHDEYMPEEYLPTFNALPIEMNIHRIKDLSENYILFNDDMFPLQRIDEDYYFRNDTVCDEAVENIIVAAGFGAVSNQARYMQVNNMMIINRHFKKREVQRKNPDLWFNEAYGDRLERTRSLVYWNDFPGLYDPHLPSAFKKKTLKKLWELEPKALDTASKNKFRGHTDLNQYLARYLQLCEGDFFPRRTEGKVFFNADKEWKIISEGIKKQEWKNICINESDTAEDFKIAKEKIKDAFISILPEKSTFELAK